MYTVAKTSQYHNLRQDYENWLRLVALIDCTGRRLCYDLLHRKEGVPDDGADFYNVLKKYKNRMLFQMHEEILSPSNEIIDETKFNLSLYTVVIRLMFGIKYKDLLHDVRDRRNKIFHMEDVSNCTSHFEELWSDACVILCKPGFCIELPSILKSCDLFSVEEYRGS